MKLEEIKENLAKCEKLEEYIPDNKFSKYDFLIKPDLVGRQVSDRVLKIAEGMDEIIRVLPKYRYLLAIADKRYKEALGKATNAVMLSVQAKKISAKTRDEMVLFEEISLFGDKKPTTVYAEYMNMSMFQYIVQMGESKLELGERMMDFGRSLLSYSKIEINKNV